MNSTYVGVLVVSCRTGAMRRPGLTPGPATYTRLSRQGTQHGLFAFVVFFLLFTTHIPHAFGQQSGGKSFSLKNANINLQFAWFHLDVFLSILSQHSGTFRRTSARSDNNMLTETNDNPDMF